MCEGVQAPARCIMERDRERARCGTAPSTALSLSQPVHYTLHSALSLIVNQGDASGRSWARGISSCIALECPPTISCEKTLFRPSATLLVTHHSCTARPSSSQHVTPFNKGLYALCGGRHNKSNHCNYSEIGSLATEQQSGFCSAVLRKAPEWYQNKWCELFSGYNNNGTEH